MNAQELMEIRAVALFVDLGELGFDWFRVFIPIESVVFCFWCVHWLSLLCNFFCSVSIW